MDIVNIRNRIRTHFKNKKEDYWKRKHDKHNSYWNKYYQNQAWYNLRNSYYAEHPICEVCEQEGIIVPADEVHHIVPFGSGINEEAKWNLLLNQNNLMSLCTKHHKIAHEIMRLKYLDKVSIDDIISYEKEKEDRMRLINEPINNKN